MPNMQLVTSLLLISVVTLPSFRLDAAPEAGGHQSRSAATAVPCGSLSSFLPALKDWVRGDIQCNPTRDHVSRVQVDYERGISGLSIELIDSAHSANVQAPLAELIKAKHSELRPDGYTRPTTVEGFPGIEEWTPEAGNGEIHLLVGDRYMVKVRGDSVPDVDTIRSATMQIALRRLAALR
jgi:hypothetical protein